MQVKTFTRRRPVRARRGTAYVAVLGVGMICTVAGLSAVTLTRVQNKTASDTGRSATARLAAQSAVEVGVYRILNDPTWRSEVFDDRWSVPEQVGPYTLTFKHLDEVDGVVSDDPGDPVRVYCSASVGDAVRVHSILLASEPVIPHAAIAAALHAGGNLTVDPAAKLRLIGGAVSAGGSVTNNGAIEGDVEAAGMTGAGTVTGDVWLDIPPKEMPDTGVAASLIAVATRLPHLGDIRACVLGPGYNDCGGPADPDGLYFIDAGNSAMVIEETRIHGTLIVRVDPGVGNLVRIRDTVLMHPHRTDYPTLIVMGRATLDLSGRGTDEPRYLDEKTIGRNFNPPGAAYDGHSDADSSDRYPSEIRGLVHVIGGDLALGKSTRVRGAVVCTNDITVAESPEVIFDPDMLNRPPDGYEPMSVSAMRTQMRIVPNSLRRDVGTVATEAAVAKGHRTPGP